MSDARIGIADTTFARIDMAQAAEDQIQAYAKDHNLTIDTPRTTVPGFKDLPTASKKLINEQDADLVIACGQAGPDDIDKQCAHEATLGLQQAQLLTDTHILEVFVHTDEVPVDQPGRLRWLGENRAREHALNACRMLFEPDTMRNLAGQGQREGFAHEGPIEEEAEPPAEAP